MTKRHEVIFQVRANGTWLDYCRETSPHTDLNPTNNWAKDQCTMLERRHGGDAFRFVVEIWQ